MRQKKEGKCYQLLETWVEIGDVEKLMMCVKSLALSSAPLKVACHGKTTWCSV